MHVLKHIPGSETLEFKESFIERYSKLTDWETFKTYCLSFLRKSIRVNTLKISVEDLVEKLSDRFILTPIPWCKEGFWIVHKEGRRDIGNTIEHMIGYYYVQESASMLPPLVLDPQPHETTLDLCAAPGSKTSQIAQYMENTGVLVANDVKGIRLAALGINLNRCGVTNVIMSKVKGEKFSDAQFDRILVDAPCSGTGTIRKSLKTIKIWNPNMVKRIAHVQRKLITHAYDLLKPGGTMVYSTCSLEPEEDEAIVDYLLKNREGATILDINLPINRSAPVLSFEGETYDPSIAKVLRIWPQDNDSEGFFVAKIHKAE
jgi:NOL1/NOP2/sun family putative RNA methylase